jgi:hypothetical protein
MKYKIFSVIIFFVISLGATAQTLQSWTWDSYKLKFKAPDNLDVKKSDATVYEATNSTMAMDIYPLTGQNLTYDGMKNAIVKWADKTGLSYESSNSSGESQPIYLKNINGLWGCAIDGTKSGFPTSILLLVNPDHPDINFYVWLSYKDEYYHDAVAILKSFAPM